MEAHAKDTWPLGEIESVPQHKTLEDRLERAKYFQAKYKMEMPVYVDSMQTPDNPKNFNDIYAAWPERFFIIEADLMWKIGQPVNEFGYNHNEIEHYIHDRWGVRRDHKPHCSHKDCTYYARTRWNNLEPLLCHYHGKEWDAEHPKGTLLL